MYVLIREKKGETVARRLEKLFESPIFVGTNRTPKNVCKSVVVALPGDASCEQFGLSDENWSTLVEEVNVIINSAASVRFDDPIVKAVNINCLSTMTCLQLCQQAINIESYVQVSTCYANCQLMKIDEKIYPTRVTVEHVMEMTKWIPSDELDKICKDELYDGRPNSYVFTKSLSEDYLGRNGRGLPVAIGRLSMVVSAQKEPEPGFIDVAQAAVFVGLTQALGALRTFDFNLDATPEVIPVDTTANAILSIAYLTAKNHKELNNGEIRPPKVYNITGRQVTYGQGVHHFSVEAQQQPSARAFRPPADLSNKPSRLSYWYNRWVTEWLFVFILEKVIRLFGFKQ